MPASLQEVKRRIESTKKTGQITGAMQMVSTAKLSQIQKHAVSYQVYAQKIRSVITHLAKSHLLDSATTGESETSQDGKINTLGMLKQRPVKKIGVVVITSDRGLVGSYNSNVIKQTMSVVNSEESNKDNVVILAIGGKGADVFKIRGYAEGYEYRCLKDDKTLRSGLYYLCKVRRSH